MIHTGYRGKWAWLGSAHFTYPINIAIFYVSFFVIWFDVLRPFIVFFKWWLPYPYRRHCQ